MSSRRFKKERHPFAYRGNTSPPNENLPDEALHPVRPQKIEEPPKAVSRTRPHSPERGDPIEWQSTWTPEFRTTVKLILSARLCSVVWSYISDCDETYNYWEPLHYVLRKRGFQTWEYSPVFAIRSYAYILLHAIPLKLYDTLFHPNGISIFYFLRLIFGVSGAAVEGFFCKAVAKRFGPSVSRMMLVFLIFSPGMFISSTAFLPSSFAMLLTTIAFACWFSGRDIIAVTAVAISVLLGWPFAGVLGVPVAIDVVRKNGVFFFIGICTMIGGVLSAAVLVVDSKFYGQLAFPPLSIVMYNIISGHGPELYGIEPWYFYLLNGFLNFNIAFILALLCPLFIGLSFLLGWKNRQLLWSPSAWNFLSGAAASIVIWLAIFFRTPHKEERFLFPIYPLIAFSAAAAIEIITKIPLSYSSKVCPFRVAVRVSSWITVILLSVFVILGLSRMFALAKFYTAPMDVYMHLNREAENRTTYRGKVTICVGKEWYRYPSSFFLPENWNLRFVQSDFKGLLPQPYAPFPGGFAEIPPNMNDENKEEVSRYVDVCQCRYFVDFDVDGTESALEPRYVRNGDEWTVVYSEKFLNAAMSHRVLRAFYVPWLSEKFCSFGDYVLLRRKKACTVAVAGA